MRGGTIVSRLPYTQLETRREDGRLLDEIDKRFGGVSVLLNRRGYKIRDEA